jgi:hypothetical protein
MKREKKRRKREEIIWSSLNLGKLENKTDKYSNRGIYLFIERKLDKWKN